MLLQPSIRMATLIASVWLAGCLSGVDEVPKSAENIRPLLTGATAPAFSLRSPLDETWDYRPGRNPKPLVLTFYRGSWCPYCNRQLAGLRHAEQNLLELGYEVVFVSPDRPEILRSGLEQQSSDYQLYSDSDLAVARKFGIAFQVSESTLQRYREKNIDLQAASGYDHYWLPVPATFIIDTDGVIRFSYVNPNYKVRLHPELLVTAARLALQPDEGL